MDEKRLDALLQEALCPPIAEEDIRIHAKEVTKTMRNSKKIMVIALAATMLVGSTVMAAGRITAYVTRPQMQEYSYEQLDAAAAKAGIHTLEFPEEFANGYRFERSDVQGWSAMDDKNNAVDKFDELDIWYGKSGTSLAFHVMNDRDDAMSEDPQPVEVRKVGETTVSAYVYHYKFVPTDYKLTPEDEAFMAIPGNEISVGSDKVEAVDMSAVIFQVDGVQYSVMDHQSTDHIGEMMDMAEELLR